MKHTIYLDLTTYVLLMVVKQNYNTGRQDERLSGMVAKETDTI